MKAMVNTYCINLARRPDRYQRMLESAQAANVELLRIEAIDGAASGNKSLIDAMPRRGPTGSMSDSTIACTLSHIKAWRAFLAAPGTPAFGIFLEDDAALSQDFAEVVMAIAKGGFGFDLVKLEGGGSLADGALLQPARPLTRGRALRQCHQLATRSAGYILSRYGAEMAVQHSAAIDVAVDHYLFYGRKRRGCLGVPFGVVVPGICGQDATVHSDIAGQRNTDSRAVRDLRRSFYEAAQAGTMLEALLFRKARLVRSPFVAQLMPSEATRLLPSMAAPYAGQSAACELDEAVS